MAPHTESTLCSCDVGVQECRHVALPVAWYFCVHRIKHCSKRASNALDQQFGFSCGSNEMRFAENKGAVGMVQGSSGPIIFLNPFSSLGARFSQKGKRRKLVVPRRVSTQCTRRFETMAHRDLAPTEKRERKGEPPPNRRGTIATNMLPDPGASTISSSSSSLAVGAVRGMVPVKTLLRRPGARVRDDAHSASAGRLQRGPAGPPEGFESGPSTPGRQPAASGQGEGIRRLHTAVKVMK